MQLAPFMRFQKHSFPVIICFYDFFFENVSYIYLQAFFLYISMEISKGKNYVEMYLQVDREWECG